MYRTRSPLRVFAVTFAIVAGALLAVGHWIAGIVLVVIALACMGADFFDHDDSDGLYPY